MKVGGGKPFFKVSLLSLSRFRILLQLHSNPDIVMVLMGHAQLKTTQRYMHLLNLNDDEWTCAGATTAKDAMKLIEAGFQYVTTIEGLQLFKRRK